MPFKKTILFSIHLLNILIVSCNEPSLKNTNPSPQTVNLSDANTTETLQNKIPIEEEPEHQDELNKSADGTYSYRDNSAEIQIIVSGANWTGKTKIISGLGDEYDESNVEYESGLIKGNDLYESSGFVKIGYIEGKSLITSIGGNNITLYRK